MAVASGIASTLISDARGASSWPSQAITNVSVYWSKTTFGSKCRIDGVPDNVASGVRGTAVVPSRLNTSMLLFTAATKKPSPSAPVVSEGKNPSRSSIASNPVRGVGARTLERGAASGSAAPGRDRCENVSNEVGRSCDAAVTRPCTTARDAVRGCGLADRSAAADGTSSNPTPATRTVRTASNLRDVRIRGLPLLFGLFGGATPYPTGSASLTCSDGCG